MEWCLPASSWRAKFDLDSYIPTCNTEEKLISERKVIERNEKINKGRKADNNNSKIHKKKQVHKI